MYNTVAANVWHTEFLQSRTGESIVSLAIDVKNVPEKKLKSVKKRKNVTKIKKTVCKR